MTPSDFAKSAIRIAIRRFGLPSELEATAFVDGKGDLGIDGLAMAVGDTPLMEPDDLPACLESGGVLDLLFVRSKRPNLIGQNDIVLFGNAVRTFLTYDEADIKNLKPSAQLLTHWLLLQSLRSARPELVAAADITLLFVYGGHWQDYTAVNVRREGAVADIAGALPSARVEFEIWGYDHLEQMRRSYGDEHTRTLTRASLMPMPPGTVSGFIGYVAGQSLVDLVSAPADGRKGRTRRADDFMFADNVRAFLGVGPRAERANPGAVGLQAALEREQHSTVVGGHNGIVIVADRAEKADDVVTLTNAQIVNGCQSSHVLVAHSGRLEGCFLPVKIVMTEDEALKDSIAIAANTQAEVDSYDILARLPNVKTLTVELSRAAVPLPQMIWLQRRRNEYVSFPTDRAEDWGRVMRPRHLLDAFAASVAGVPETAHGDPRKIVELARNSVAFHPDHDPMLYRALAWMIVTGRRWASRHNRKWYDRYERSFGGAYPARHHYISALWHIVDPSPEATELSDLTRSRAASDRFVRVIERLLADDGMLGDSAGRAVDQAVPQGRSLNADLSRTAGFTRQVVAKAKDLRASLP